MQIGSERLKNIFQHELSSLRDEASEFAQDFPEQATALGIHRGRSQDPHVEMLMQSFAYLTGRLRYQLEVDQALLPNALLADLYPHLEGPLPSMLVAEIDVKVEGLTFSKGVVVSRSRHVMASVPGDDGQPLDCTFRTCNDLMLWPLRITEVTATSPDDYPTLVRGLPEVRSVLRVRLQRLGRETLSQLQPRKLRFFINPDSGPAHTLHALLSAHLQGVAVLENPTTSASAPRLLADDVLRWCGFDDGEAVLPINQQAHPAYRILQEYFAFPEKFMFFELDALTLHEADDFVDLLFLLDTPPDSGMHLNPRTLALNCVPMVNLYSQRIDPLTLDHTRYEYRMTGDMTQHRNCEIYRIEQLQAIRPDGSPRAIAPYFAMDDFRKLETQDYFYFMRRELSQRAGTGGTEMYVSFLDPHFQLTDPADEVVGGSALCTNRRTPERLRVGDKLAIEGAAPISAMRVLIRPTAHQVQSLTGTRPWALASQLALNHLSLAGNPQALSALKDLLRLHVGPSSTLGQRAIDG
ncbi:MAG: hypothetical protein JWM03_1473, partial [Rhodocyclales bacterium]|nr:hypothetical protein [Rhodocyclales bacterium]